MRKKLEVFADESCTIPLNNLGELEVGESNNIDFFVKNIGKTYLISAEVEVTFPGARRVTADIPKEIKPGQVFRGMIEFNPTESDEGIKRGSINLKAKSVGEESVFQ